MSARDELEVEAAGDAVAAAAVLAPVEEIEVAVVGGGVAGCALATALARKGVPCVLLEREREVPDVLRGELIMPRGVAILDELGLGAALRATCAETEGVVLHHPAFEGGACSIDYDLAPPPEDVPAERWRPRGLSGWRRPLYEALGRAASAAGVDRREGWDVARATRDAQGRLVLGARDPRLPRVAARLVVAADGTGSRLRRLRGFDPVEQHEETIVQGFVGRAPAAHGLARVEVGVHPLGAVFFFPFPGGLFRCTFEYRKEYLNDVQGDDALARHRDALAVALPHVHARLGAFEVLSRLGLQPGRTVTLSSVVEDGFALVGDAAGSLDPFTGFGMTLALTDAQLLAEVVAGARGDYGARTLRAYERRRAPGIAARREATDALAYLFLDKAEGFAPVLAERLAARWADRDLVLRLVAARFAGYDPPVEPSFGLKNHFLGLL